MNTRSLRGQVQEGTVKRLILDDGRLNHGYKITKFIIAGDPSSFGNDAYATLGLDYDTPLVWNWGDNRQIGWASTNVAQTSGVNTAFSVLDPDHIVIMDLWIQGQVSAAGGSSVINYYIELEPVNLTDDQAVLQLIKERSQDDLR
jgi:hypothetical protein